MKKLLLYGLSMRSSKGTGRIPKKKKGSWQQVQQKKQNAYLSILRLMLTVFWTSYPKKQECLLHFSFLDSCLCSF